MVHARFDYFDVYCETDAVDCPENSDDLTNKHFQIISYSCLLHWVGLALHFSSYHWLSLIGSLTVVDGSGLIGS